MGTRCLAVVLALIFAACTRRATGPSALSPQAELKSFQLNDDLNIELFVNEPEIMSPVEMVFDENGYSSAATLPDTARLTDLRITLKFSGCDHAFTEPCRSRMFPRP